MSKASQVEVVHRLQRYIAEHLHEPISLQQLASVSGYSPWYTARLFKAEMGLAAFDYIRRLRLTAAAKALRDGEQKVIDVAFDFVFDSPSGFSRAFSKQFGISPKRYAQKPVPIRWFMPYDVKHIYLSQMRRNQPMSKSNQTIFTQVVEKPARKLLLKRGVKARHYFEYCDEVGAEVWGTLCSVSDALGEPMGLWFSEKQRPQGTSEYVQGVEVPLAYDAPLPEGYELIELPPCKMMVFQGPAFNDEDFGEAIESLWQCIDRYDPELYGFAWAPEAGPRFQLEPQGYRGYIEGRAVKALS